MFWRRSKGGLAKWLVLFTRGEVERHDLALSSWNNRGDRDEGELDIRKYEYPQPASIMMPELCFQDMPPIRRKLPSIICLPHPSDTTPIRLDWYSASVYPPSIGYWKPNIYIMRRVEAAKFEFIPTPLSLSVTLLTRTPWLYVTLEAWMLVIRA